MTIGYHSPMPPAATGVADYSAALLPELQQFGEVVCNPRGDCTIDLYHIGNNRLHGEVYQRALRRPGIVVLHDAALSHFFLDSLDESAYVEEFVSNYGEWYRGMAHALWRGRARSAIDPAYFEWPMIGRVCRKSLGVIVHNPGAAATVLRHAPRARVVEIPHLWSPVELPCIAEVLCLRDRLRVPHGALVAGVFGHLRETKRLGAILRVCARLRAAGEPVWLLVAGEFVSRELERSLARELAQPGVIRIGFLDERDFWLYARVVDVCLNLRYPSAGESSGIAVRLMGAGRATMLTAGAETSRFPDGVCMRCDAGVAEEDQIAAFLLWALRDRERVVLMGEAAADYIRREHGVARVARLYAEAIDPALREQPVSASSRA